jgi:hypothetical protein
MKLPIHLFRIGSFYDYLLLMIDCWFYIQLNDEDDSYMTIMQRYSPVPAKKQQDIQLGDEQDSICVLVYCRQTSADQPKYLAKVMPIYIRLMWTKPTTTSCIAVPKPVM